MSPKILTSPNSRVILGIDPGLAHCGWGVISKTANRYKTVGFGDITTKPTDAFSDRLLFLFDSLKEIIDKYSPSIASMETIYFKKNVTSAMPVAHARGAMIVALRSAGIPVVEYSPLEIKRSVVGVGRADKEQIQQMMALLLNLSTPPKPDHAADALAAAITALHEERRWINNEMEGVPM